MTFITLNIARVTTMGTTLNNKQTLQLSGLSSFDIIRFITVKITLWCLFIWHCNVMRLSFCLGGKLVGKPFLTCENNKIFCDEEVSHLVIS